MSATPVLAVSADAPDHAALQRAAEVLRRGGTVAFATETVYGLGASALDEAAVGRIFAAKGRPPGNPVIVHVRSLSETEDLVTDFPPLARVLAEAFWPGPLTLVLPKSRRVPGIVTAGGPTVALRVPAHPVALALLDACRFPLAAPSANRSSQLSPTRAEHVLRSLDGRIDLVLDSGPTTGGIESTVLDVNVEPPVLLRPGLITRDEMQALIGPIRLRGAAPANEHLRSPGLLRRHYAPQTPLECVRSGRERVEALVAAGQRVGWLTFGPVNFRTPGSVVIMSMATEPDRYAASLYDALHALDAAGLDRLIVELPPADDAWLAIHDRLRRAAES